MELIASPIVQDIPVLLIAWRRPDTLRKVLDAIRPVAPMRLYVACDGPNPERHGEADQVAATRFVIANEIDWPCQIEVLFSDVNQGCRIGVSRAITWFFEQVEEGIILEDDCVPHPDFFNYCGTLLDRYRHDLRVWCISGNNFQKGQWRGDGSYYFSRYNHCWGWATWRRCWQHYDGELSQWIVLRDSGLLETIFEDPLERNYWSEIWQKLLDKGEPDSWAYRWTFTCLANGGLTALPNRNLVSNVGFGSNATHTKIGVSTPLADESIIPIFHPTFVIRNRLADHFFVRTQLLPSRTIASMFKNLFSTISRNLKCMKAKFSSSDSHSPGLPRPLLGRFASYILSRKKRYIPGVLVSAHGLSIHYSDPITLLAGHKEIFMDCVYDFQPSHDKPVIIDCGANIGLASIWFALKFSDSLIFSFEADPDIFKLFQANIISFGLHNQVVPANLAVWKDSLGINFDQEGGFSGQVSGHGHEFVKRVVHVPSITLNELLSSHERVDLLKVDIEGAENEIFSENLDLSVVHRLFLEYHSHKSDAQTLDKILNCLTLNGFRYHVKEAYSSPNPFLKVNSMLGMDLQLNIYAFRQ